jgi:Raf kinase inhibitor-like YbhB/YbcL family protein
MIGDLLIRAATLLTTVGLAAGAADGQFRLTSPDFSPGGTLNDEQAFNGMGCTGKNVSPALRWSGAPAGTRSFALLLHDPDAPTGGAGWWHWIAYDIPPGTSELAKGAGTADGSAMPKGSASVANDYGTQGYGGPCPPEGDKPHRYVFTLYALKVDKLELPKGAHAPVVGFVVNANTLAKASVTGMYGRTRK